MHRRQFLQAAALTPLAPFTALMGDEPRGAQPTLAIIDCHTHFFDPLRPDGVPWPGKDSPLYRPTYPRDYQRQPVPHPVVATVVVEASAWVEDNQWVLDLARNDRFIVGLCGNLDPVHSEFPAELTRFGANPVFRGIRVSGAVVERHVKNSAFIANLGRLADRGLQLDTNGPANTLPAVAQLARAIPGLRIVINHLANIRIDGTSVNADWRRDIEAVAAHPRVFAKVSGLVEAAARVRTPVPVTTTYYAPYLDVLWNAFGEDRLIYGSNWPVSGQYAPLHDVQRVVHEYFSARGSGPLAKVFASNARVVYGV